MELEKLSNTQILNFIKENIDETAKFVAARTEYRDVILYQFEIDIKNNKKEIIFLICNYKNIKVFMPEQKPLSNKWTKFNNQNLNNKWQKLISSQEENAQTL